MQGELIQQWYLSLLRKAPWNEEPSNEDEDEDEAEDEEEEEAGCKIHNLSLSLLPHPCEWDKAVGIPAASDSSTRLVGVLESSRIYGRWFEPGTPVHSLPIFTPSSPWGIP